MNLSNTHSMMLATLPPEEAIEIPRSMKPEEKDKLVSQLGLISNNLAAIKARDHERQKFLDQRFRAQDARMAKYDERMAKYDARAEASGQHDIVALQKKLDERRVESNKWKWWVLSIAASLMTSALVGLVVFYLTKK